MKKIQLRPGQKEVCSYRGGFLAVPSVPGAGKTFTLAMLAAELIREGKQEPGKILIVTYMNAAVSNFKNRIGELLEQYGLPKNQGFEVMTLHSLAMKILREKPEVLLLTEDFVPVDEIEQIRIMQRATALWIQENPEAFKSYLQLEENEKTSGIKRKVDQWAEKAVRVVKEIISYCKCSRISIQSIPKILEGTSKSSLLPLVLTVYEQYEKYLRHMGLIDFDDLIVKAIELLKIDPGLRERLQNKYTYIFEDEAQDSSILQEELLMILAEKSGNLLRVGDSNQSILSTFTVSDPKLFKKYCDRPDTQLERILVSSRSSKDILDTANYLVEWSREFHPVEICRNSLEYQLISPVGEGDPFPNPRPPGYTIGKLLAKSRKEEFRKIVKNAEKQMGLGKTIAILIPAGFIMDEIKEILDQQKLPYREVTSYPKERTRAVEILGSLLDYLSHPHDNQKLVDLLIDYLQKDLQEEEKIVSFLRSSRLEDLFYPQAQWSMEEQIPEEIREKANWKILMYNIVMLRDLLEATFMEPEALILYIGERLHFDDEQMAIAQKIASDVRYMMNINPSWRMAELAQQLKSIKNAYNYFANLVYDRKGFDPEPGVINLMTYHKSKGMEFDTVYLTCLTAEEFPASLEDKFKSDFWFLKTEYKNPVAVAKAELDLWLGKELQFSPIEQARIENIQERLRLLYVGITRAKENLLLSSHEIVESEFGKKNVSPSTYFHVLKDYIEGKGSHV